ncbi:MAG: hypothetical protein ACFFDN_10800 [Candidatus Hodarchaeota archaeon]
MKHWFIAYEVIENIIGVGLRSILFNILIENIHPFEWLNSWKEKCEPNIIRIIWFTEITEDQFNEYKEMIEK